MNILVFDNAARSGAGPFTVVADGCATKVGIGPDIDLMNRQNSMLTDVI
jgi:hypothetical protein